LTTGNIFNPVEESKDRWDLTGYSDPQIYQHLSDPAKFRSTFPEYGHLGDDEIAQGMQRTGLRNPQYGAIPSVQPPAKANVQFPTDVDSVTGISEDSPMARFGTRVGAKLAEDVPNIVKGAATPFGVSALKNAWTAGKQTYDLYKNGKAPSAGERASQLAGAAGVDAPAVAEAAQNKDWPGLAAETVTPIAENIALGKLMPGGNEADAALPTTGEKAMMRRALRPQDRDLRFDQHVQNAWPDVKAQVAQKGAPADLPDFDNMLKDAKKGVWDEYTAIKNKAATSRPEIKGLLQAPAAEIDTGVQQVKGEAPGGVIPAESRSILKKGPPASFVQAARKDAPGATVGGKAPGIGSTNATVPQRILGTQPEIGSQYSVVPDSVMGPKTVQSEQFLSGGAHPEMSGRLTDPATLITRDPVALRATRDRLAGVMNNEDHWASLSPSEQTAYTSQLNRLNNLLKPGPATPYGPAIDGNAVASAIEQSIRPRTRLLQGGVLNELQSRAEAYRGRQIPINDAEELLQDANREASAWYSQATRDPHGPAYAVSSAAEAGAIRDQMYRMIDTLSGSDPGAAKSLKQRYGALDALHDYTAKRIPVASRQAPLNLWEGGGLVAGAEMLAQAQDLRHLLGAPVPWMMAKAAKRVNSPEFLLKAATSPYRVPAPIRGAIAAGAKGTAIRATTGDKQ
jgi:hypothetical protein